MAKQLMEFSKQSEKSKTKPLAPTEGGRVTSPPSKTKPLAPTEAGRVTSPPLMSAGVSSSATESSWTGVTSTTDMSHDMTSELESADDSDKNLTTSDTDSDKLTGGRIRSPARADGRGKYWVYILPYSRLLG